MKTEQESSSESNAKSIEPITCGIDVKIRPLKTAGSESDAGVNSTASEKSLAKGHVMQISTTVLDIYRLSNHLTILLEPYSKDLEKAGTKRLLEMSIAEKLSAARLVLKLASIGLPELNKGLSDE